MSCSTNPNPFGMSSSRPFGVSYTPAFSSNTTSNASSSPTFNSVMPAFGVSYIPAFGGSSSASTTPLFSFGTSTQAFDQSSSAFGTSGLFGSTTSIFGGQSSAFGSQTPTPAFENTGIGQSEFGGQRGGSRVPSYSTTTEIDGGFGKLVKYESISTMSAYKDKSHEQLRWEDYQLRDKGGPLASARQSTAAAPSIFGSPSSPFGANSSSQPFNSSTSPFGANTSSQPFGSSKSSPFGSSIFSNTQPFPLFNSSAPTNPQSGSTFGHNTSPFGQSSAFSQSSLFSSPSSGLVGSIFSNSASLTSDKSYATQTNLISPSPVFAQSSANPFSSTTPGSNNPFAPKTSTFASGYGTSAPAFSSSAFDSSTTSAFGTSGSLASGASSIPAFGFCSSTEACGQSSSTSAFGGPQNYTQAVVNTGFGQPRFVGHRRGSRVASYSATSEENSGTSGQIGNLNSISAMPFYKDKSHEELRWEDYQLGTKAFGQLSSLPFCSSQSVFGQQNNSSNNPSVSKPFGNSSTTASVFGATQTLSPFSSNTTSSASSSPAFNSSMPASGASSTPAFGLSVFGQKPAFGGFRPTPTQTSPFGSAIQPPQPTFGSNTQQSQPTFRSSIFDSSARLCPSSQPVFGSTSTPAFHSTNTPAYGATTPAFSFGTSTQAFCQSSSAFGTSSPFGSTTSAFGGQSSAFGSQTPTQAFGNTGIGQSEFGGQRGGSRVASYSATTETDGGYNVPGKLESVSAMPVYKDKSHEELRWEDNQLGDKGGPLASATQSTAPAFSSSAFGSSSTSVFGTSSSPAFGASSIPAFSFFSSTEDKDLCSSRQTENLESISAILVYKDKSHEELRWEDYQLGSSAPTIAQSGSEFGQNTSPFGQTAGFRPSSFFSSLSSGLVGSILSSRASLTSNAPDWAVSYQGRGSMVSLAILTGTVFATVAVSGWISHRCRRA
ncbi:hypothetical protein P8452_03200 [Trifolium repens]|nr:hypothetical protein P8452_03200 [Trifolium repens]